MGFANNHTLFDGTSFKLFLENLASVAWGKPLAFAPNNDRHLLDARSPPRVAFSHPELVEFPPVPSGQESQLTIFEPTPDNLRFKVFKLRSDDIAGLKEKAKDGGASGPSITGFNVVTAHIWRCRVLANTAEPVPDPEKTHTVLYAVDIRSRLQPPLPRSYTGNAVLTGYGAATRRELEGGSFSWLVEAVREGNTRMNDEYARSIIDWGQLHRGYPRGDVMISSWWRLGFGDVDFPWGKPIYCCPVLIPTMDIVVFYPDVESADHPSTTVNVCIALPPENMKKTQEESLKAVTPNGALTRNSHCVFAQVDPCLVHPQY
ncbi:hypothetical protein ACLOJK_011909 [Asimina triloba]